MIVYLVRHAIAEERGSSWPDDRERPLSEKGITRFRDISARLADRGVHVGAIFSSPLVRARQTAELLVPAWADVPIQFVEELAPGGTPASLARTLADRAAHEAVALVGHEPDLGALAAWMIGAKAPLPFKKGGVARIDCGDTIKAGEGTLVWMVTPKLVLGA
jgi:phosphohistidine phosphatase